MYDTQAQQARYEGTEQREPAWRGVVDGLEKETARLAGLVEQLEQRLDPVMRGPQPPSANKVAEGIESVLPGHLARIRDRQKALSVLCARIQDTLYRLEI